MTGSLPGSAKITHRGHLAIARECDIGLAAKQGIRTVDGVSKFRPAGTMTVFAGVVMAPAHVARLAQKVALRLWNARTSPNPSQQRNPSDSAYRLFGVYFERRESMVPTLRGDVEALRENGGGWRGSNAKMSREFY
jgi:hypothetical protein